MFRVRYRNHPVSDYDKGRIIEYRVCDLSYRIIAARVRRDLNTVSNVCNRWVQDGNMERPEGSQRPLSLEAEKTSMLPTWSYGIMQPCHEP
ncbi:hypothetical protein TNCV_3343621 [Trichonephila clavipes]|nr:hypothetical protein TNCV_3343621 [Trichonephila clavipes]